ncbi:MAG: integrase arm-type DNA-binding domain-containing protein [Candidatus Methanomethyliaceae archaeon]
MALTDLKVKNAKPGERPYKMYDEKGLYLLVTPSGGKWWRLRYTYRGKEKTISLGTYPRVSLKEARERRDRMREILASGLDPSSSRKKTEIESLTFRDIVWRWYNAKKPTWAPVYAETLAGRIRNYVEPLFGHMIPDEINPPEIYRALARIQEEGKLELAYRIKQIVSMAYRYAIVNGLATRDPTSDLGKGVLITPKTKYRPTILEPERIGELMRAINGYESVIVRSALRLLALTFVRPGELRGARWDEIKWDERLWEIPPHRTKMRRPHLVPLSMQALKVIEGMKIFSKGRTHVFPSSLSGDRPISENTLNAALRRMGFSTKEEITSHGFRAMARTILHERLGYPPDVIEIQLGHKVPDRLGEAYNRAKFLEERRRMMQDWADYLDSCARLRGA